MLKRLFSQQKNMRQGSASCSRPIYAIGDIHGRMDLLAGLLSTITSDITLHKLESHRPIIIFLGDYIDRGPSSRAVVDAILTLRQDPSVEVHALKGNHEQALLLFLDDALFGPTWIAHGGANTLSSYGIALPNLREGSESLEKAQTAFRSALGSAHLDFFARLEMYVRQDDYLFVHAGIRWGIPLDEQKEEDLLWIRGDFLNADQMMDMVVVHGHTPAEQPFIGRGRIGIDTGAYATGILTAVKLWNSETTILQSR